MWIIFTEFLRSINSGDVEERKKRKGAQKETVDSSLHYYKGSWLASS